jgi:hypothetical protein
MAGAGVHEGRLSNPVYLWILAIILILANARYNKSVSILITALLPALANGLASWDHDLSVSCLLIVPPFVQLHPGKYENYWATDRFPERKDIPSALTEGLFAKHWLPITVKISCVGWFLTLVTCLS